MKKLFLLCLVSTAALADPNEDNARMCGAYKKKPGAQKCLVKACDQGLLCDYNCGEKWPDGEDHDKFKACQTDCWKKALDKMNSCG